TGARVGGTPTRLRARMSQSLMGSSADKPLLSAIATADQVWAAGAGNWSVPSAWALGTSAANVNTVTTVPTKMPANWARNCCRGWAPSKYPLFKSPSRSAAEVAAPAVMLALIKLTLTLPGLSPPKMSCVTLPMASTGVVSVSPVTLQATSASTKDKATARMLCQTGMPKLTCPSQARAPSEMSCPTANQLIGASMASVRPGSKPAVERKENIRPRSRNALIAVRQLRAKLKSPAATMHEAPNQSVHCTTTENPAPVMTPLACRTGTSTAQ